MQSQYFVFDGIQSELMGIHIVRMERGMIPTPYMGSKNIRDVKVFGRDMPYFYGVEKGVIRFDLQMSLLDEEWTPQRRYEIARWLFQDVHKPFQTSDDLGKYYYAICTNAENLFLADSKGFVNLTFTTNAPYAFSQVYTNTFDLTENDTTETIMVENNSNVGEYYYPKIEFALSGDSTGLSLKNLSDNNRIFEFTDLTTSEIISVDNKNKYILSNVPAVYRFQNFNKNWLRLRYGQNFIEVTGKCDMVIKTQFPILQ